MKDLKHFLAGLSLFAALSAPAFVASPASAQATTAPAAPAAPGAPKAARQGRGGGGRRLTAGTIAVGALDYVVGLKDDQKTKITDIHTKAAADDKAATGDAVKIKEINDKATADVEAILTDEQKTKLKEALPKLQVLQQSRAIALANLADLKLTDDQKSKINAAIIDTQAKMKAAPKGDRAARQTILADLKTAVDAVLTEDQKKIATARAKKAK